MHWSMRSFNIPHWATHGHLTVFSARGSREFEPCLAGVGNLNRKCQLFPAEHKCYVYKYAGVSAKCFTIASEWLRRKVLKGQGFKAWSTCRRVLSLMLPFTKKWVGHMTTREFEQTNLQKNVQASNWWTHNWIIILIIIISSLRIGWHIPTVASSRQIPRSFRCKCKCCHCYSVSALWSTLIAWASCAAALAVASSACTTCCETTQLIFSQYHDHSQIFNIVLFGTQLCNEQNQF